MFLSFENLYNLIKKGVPMFAIACKSMGRLVLLTGFSCAALSATYYGQFGGEQDRFCNEVIFKSKKNGVFFDIGAYDGVAFSNTCFFEKELEWGGVCVEPQADRFKLLCANRRCTCLHGCIFDRDGEINFIHVDGPSNMLSGIAETYAPAHLERAKREIKELGGKIVYEPMKSFRLNSVCQKYGIRHIDLLSIDTEGSEERILRDIDFNSVEIDVIIVENNYNDISLLPYLKSKGYRLFKRLTIDDVYVRDGFTV